MQGEASQKNIFKKIAHAGLSTKARLFFAQDFFQSQIARWLLLLSAVANLADWIALKIFIKPVDFPIILHYNVFFGVDTLGDWKETFYLPSIGLILLLINGRLALQLYKKKERIAGYLMLMAALMIQLSLLVASTSIIIINY